MEQSNIKIDELEKNISAELESFKSDLAKADSFSLLENIRTKYLGKKSYLSTMQKSIGTLPNELKPVVGKNTIATKNANNKTVNALFIIIYF